MSMPAVGDGRLYVAYPDSRGDRRHYLAAFDLADGRECWKQSIGGEVITAPVLAEGHVYLATLDGPLCCFRQDGTPVWQDRKTPPPRPSCGRGSPTSAGAARCPSPQPGAEAPQQTEHIARRGLGAAAETLTLHCTGTPADYLDYGKRRRRSPMDVASEHADGAVGFGAHKGDAKMAQAMRNLGKGHISAVWAHQGPGRVCGAAGSTAPSATHCTASIPKRASPTGSGQPRKAARRRNCSTAC